MGDSFTTPPLPTNDGGAGASDFVGSLGTTVSQDWDSAVGLAEKDADRLGKWLGSVWDNSQITEKSLALLAKVLAWVVLEVAEVEVSLLEKWIGFETTIYKAAAPVLAQAGADEATVAMGILLDAMGGTPGEAHNFGASAMAKVSAQAFNKLIQPFTLINSGLDPSKPGSGIAAQQYLLEKALGSSLQEWIVDQLGNHLGMGFFKTLGPFLGVLDRSVNPSNIVRQAMDSSFTFMMKAPLTRDLNRQFPVKDLGLTALAKLFVRGAIDQPTYLDRCLDTGLNAAQAQQLVLETAKLLSPGSIAKLLNLGFLHQADAEQLLAQQGYQPATITAQLYVDTHERYFKLQERVGEAAVTAWKHGYITQTRLEQILQLTGYTQDEITLLEIEGEFVKSTTTHDHITYGQIKAMYEENIIAIDDVITFLEAKGYTQAEVINLVLLDFTAATERAARRNVLEARLRVTAETEKVQATAAIAKSEQALADAKNALASELQAEASALGTPLQRAGILTLLHL